MADFLVLAEDRTGALGTGPGVWRQGDVVEVRAPGQRRGTLEGPPTFVWVECASIAVADARQYMAAHEDTDGSLLLRRRYRVAQVVIDTALAQGGVVSYTRQQLSKQLVDKLA